MRKIIAVLPAVLVWPVWAGQSLLLKDPLSAAVGLPGPPTFTYQANTGTLSGSGAGPYTSGAVAIGAASANRRVYVTVGSFQGGASVTACTIGGVTCDVTYTMGTGTNLSGFIVSAVVPTGTTAALSVTFNTTPGSFGIAYFYTTDTTTLSSITPYVSSTQNVASGTTVTGTLSTITNGSVVLSLFGAFGITNGSQNISGTTLGVAQDDSFSSQAVGHANNVTSSSGTVTYSWTTSTSGGALILAAVR